MSTFSSKRSPKSTSFVDSQASSKYLLPGPTLIKEKNPLASSLRKKSPLLSRKTEEQQGDYFSKSKELLVSSRNFLSPQLARLRAETPTYELPSTLKSSGLFRASTTTNRNRVKFDLGDQTLSAREQEKNPETFKSPEREPARIFNSTLSPPRTSNLSSSRQSYTLKQGNRRNFEELAQRMNNLEQKMESDTKTLSPSHIQLQAQSFVSRTQSQYNGETLKTETSERNEEMQPRRSRLKFFPIEDSIRKTELPVQTENSKDDNGRFSQNYVENLKETHREKVKELEKRYRDKYREFEDYRAETTSKIEELKREIQRLEEMNNEETRKVQREIEFEASKRIQESEFEAKTLKSKNRDLEEQLANANRKIETLQRDLKASEASYKELSNEHKDLESKYQQEITSIQEQSSMRIQQLTEKHEKERKRLKDSYERLVNELSQENKQTYKNLNDEIVKRDKRFKDLEREREELQRSLYSKLEVTGQDLHILQETNKSQKRNLEECREEILRLTSLLDDKKRENYILETQIELLRTEKSRYESEFLKGEKSPLRQLSASSTGKRFQGFVSPK